MRWLGFTVQMGKIVALQKDSVAQRAGFRVGDKLLSFNGQPVGDPLTLPQRLFDLAGTEVLFEVQRQGKTETLRATPESAALTTPLGQNLALEGLGLAYTIENVVADVAPDSEAARSGLAAGHRLVSVELRPADEKAQQVIDEWGMKRLLKAADVNSADNWLVHTARLKLMPPGVQVHVTYEDTHARTATGAATKKKPDTKTVVLAPVELPGAFHVERGMGLMDFERVHTAQGVGEALALGTRETQERLTDVVVVLGLLFSGRVSMDNLGGPIRIAAIAGHEAAQGVPRLLMFLTLLSANLALLNALPIPVLDGGHFLFLLIEGLCRRPVSEKWQTRLTLVGFMFLLGLMLYVFANDIHWLFL
jgi:regulator of sigma E protease